jgi:hypothetical protein
MDRSFGPEPRLYALSMQAIPIPVVSQFVQDIRKYLLENKHVDSFGSLFDVGVSANTKVMCCVFGSKTPDKFGAPTELISKEIRVPVLVINDSISAAALSNSPPPSWINQPVHHASKIDLSGYSVGQQGDMDEAGSFGFYAEMSQQVIYGFTAAHCTPRAEKESIIVSPSTRELTGRLQAAVRYTTFAPHPIRKVAAREAEVRSLLSDWKIEDFNEGCEIIDRVEGDKIQARRIKLDGRYFGAVKGKSATYKGGILDEHNRRLDSQMAIGFGLPESVDGLEEEDVNRKLSRIEWCCFEVSKDRWVQIALTHFAPLTSAVTNKEVTIRSIDSAEIG